MARRPRPELSLVIPIYNEEEVLPQLDVRLKGLLKKLGTIETEVMFVNDGSKDKSLELLRRMASHELRYRVLGFSRNFGHQRAITAGMDKSRGQAVVVMDADLQDPPEVILEMVAKWKEGYDVVYGRRRSRVGESWFKLFTAKIFYRMFRAMIPIEVPLDTGDFRLMSRRVVSTMRGLRETHRFVRGLVAWVGFRQTEIQYDRAARAAGETKYPLRKMIQFAIDGIASFSIQPLRFATYVGALVGLASVLYGIVAIISNYVGLTVPGWTTTVVLVSFLFSVQFFMIGVLGEYVGRIYEQVKRRPLYIVSERINFGKKHVEKLVTQDLEDFGGSADESMALLPKMTESGPADIAHSPPEFPIPPPPHAIAMAGAAAEAAITGGPPPVKTTSGSVGVVSDNKEAAHQASRPPPPPRQATQSARPPPVKLSSSVANIHVAPATKESPKESPKQSAPPPAVTTTTSKASPSIPPPPGLPKRPSIPAMKAATTTATAPRPAEGGKSVPPKAPSIIPPGQKTPSMIPPVVAKEKEKEKDKEKEKVEVPPKPAKSDED